jgi:hypothetical protein
MLFCSDKPEMARAMGKAMALKHATNDTKVKFKKG